MDEKNNYEAVAKYYCPPHKVARVAETGAVVEFIQLQLPPLDCRPLSALVRETATGEEYLVSIFRLMPISPLEALAAQGEENAGS